MPGGRPRKGAYPLGKRVTVRFTEEEHELLCWLAGHQSLDTAEFLRTLARREISPYSVEGIIKRDTPPAECIPGPLARTYDTGNVDLEYCRTDGFIMTHSYRNGELAAQIVGDAEGKRLWLDSQPPSEWVGGQGQHGLRLRTEQITGRPGDDSLRLCGTDSVGVEYEVMLYADGRPDSVDIRGAEECDEYLRAKCDQSQD